MPNTRTGLLGVSAFLSVPFTWFLMYCLVNGSAPDWFNHFMVSTGGAPLKSGQSMAPVPSEMQPEWILLLAFVAVFAFMIATLLFGSCS